MKKSTKSVLSIILAVTLLFGTSTAAFAADNSAIITATNAVNSLLNAAFSLLEFLMPDPDYKTVEEYYAGESENFYEGTEEFLDAPADGAAWRLGFGAESIVPADLAYGSKAYYTGGYFTQQVSTLYDDQGVNAIAMNDNSNRGTAIFASIDGLGVNNADIRAIRAEVERKLMKKGIISDIVAININSTHCHTVVDTQGFSLELIPKALRQILANIPGVDTVRSIDETFLATMIDGASDAIVEAYLNMEFGELYYYETVGIARDEEKGVYTQDEYAYLTNKRYDTEGYQNFIACFKFVPSDENSTPTVFANVGAHPTTIDRSTDKLSADFPHYIEEDINAAGMNFMFIQGAQSPISVRKSGVETPSVVERVENETDYKAAKSLGYEFARLIIEAEKNAVKVEPVLNVKMAECTVKLDKGLLEVGVASGLLGATGVIDDSSSSGYSIISEVGYIEIGTDIVMLTVPGELIPQLVYGNVVTAEDAYLSKDWEIPCTADLIDDSKTILVMGLCNDAIGYIIPDNDYAPFIADSLWNSDLGQKLFGEYHRHYEESLSCGGSAASCVMTALNSLVESAN